MSAASEAICAALRADSQLAILAPGGVYPNIAPEGTSYPYVVVSAQSPPLDNYTFGGSAYQSSVYLIKVVDENLNPAPAEDARARVQAVLQDGSLTISGQTLLMIRRRQQMPELAEVNSGFIYQVRGALYDVVVQ